jgi:hypothetical protein
MKKKFQNIILPILALITLLFFLPSVWNKERVSPGTFTSPLSEQKISVTPELLDQFAALLKKIAEIQVKHEREMLKVLDENELPIETYNEIALAREENPDEPVLGITNDELTAFNNAKPKIEQINDEMMIEVITTVEEDEMEAEKFQELFILYQQNEEFREEVNSRIFADLERK